MSDAPRACTELVIVCCHAFWRMDSEDPFDEASWHLKSFQKSDESTSKLGEHLTFVAHLQAASDALRRPQAYVVFSGGHTDPNIPYSEAEGYCNAFEKLNFSGISQRQKHLLDIRWSCESHSTDSYQNLLFSVLEFQEKTGNYPEVITIITHAFKADRFLKLHAKAIRWESRPIRVIGINPSLTSAELEEVTRLEARNAFTLFQSDPYGILRHLCDKRLQRGWKASILEAVAHNTEDEVQDLLQWHETTVFPGQLPWL